LYKGDASELTGLLGDEKYDIVISTWMTEYLDETKLSRFFSESKQALNDNGMLITTMISKYGMGFIYITLARLLKGIDKYNYHKKKAKEELKKAGFQKITIINLDSWFHFPWAYMVIAE
jgi:predicted TPR repeat methyltransferase